MSSPVETGAAGHTRSRRTWLKASASMGTVLALSFGYEVAQWHSAALSEARELQTTTVPSTSHAALLHLAAATNLFVEGVLDVTSIPANCGRVDLVAVAELPFVAKVVIGQGLSIVNSVSSACSEMAVIAWRDRRSKVPSDPKGKKIGVTRGSCGEYVLQVLLIRHPHG